MRDIVKIFTHSNLMQLETDVNLYLKRCSELVGKGRVTHFSVKSIQFLETSIGYRSVLHYHGEPMDELVKELQKELMRKFDDDFKEEDYE